MKEKKKKTTTKAFDGVEGSSAPTPIVSATSVDPHLDHGKTRGEEEEVKDWAGSEIEEYFSSLLLHRVYPRYLIHRVLY